MMRKFVCLLIGVLLIASPFFACTTNQPEQHVHTPTISTEMQGNEKVEISSCSECGEVLSETLIARYVAPGIAVDLNDATIFTVESAQGLINFNKIMNSQYVHEEGYFELGKPVFAGKTVIIGDDIDITGYDWIPVILDPGMSGMTIDGGGHTITGLTLNGSTDIGFIGLLQTDLTVKNLNFAQAKLTTTGKWCGFLIGHQEGGAFTAENVNFTDCKLWGTVSPYAIRLGCIIGYCYLASSVIDIKDCSVSNSEFYGYHNTCALIGTLAGAQMYEDKWKISGCSVNDNTFMIGTTTPMYVNPYTVDTTYMERDAMEAYIEQYGNTQQNNTFEYGVTQNPFTPDL